MSVYSIAQLEKLTGIKAHTIRIWEQRYGLIEPRRTDSNIRLYNDEELRKLLNTSLLINAGHKISKIAAYSDRRVSEIINEIVHYPEQTDLFSEAIIGKLISSGLAFNESVFEKSYSSALLKLGLEETYKKIIYPMLVRVGVMWTTSEISPGQEHFISNIIRQKLFTAIDSLPINTKSKRKWVLFLPGEEDHETGLLFANYILKQAGQNVIYLGSRVPFESLKTAIHTTEPTDILFFIVRNQPDEVLKKYIKEVEKVFKKSKIIVTANNKILERLKPGGKTKFISTIEQFYKNI